MKLTIIGNYGPYPVLGGATSGYLFEDNDIKVMLDFGCGILSKIDGYVDVENLNAIILSHTHFDHSADLLTLSYRLKNKIKLYMPEDQEGGLAETIEKLNCYDVVRYNEKTEFVINGCMFSFARMIHPVTSFAVKIRNFEKTFVYTGDTIFCDELMSFCKGATTILADASQKEDVKNPHMTVRDAAFLAKESGAKVICTHIPPLNCGNTDDYENVVSCKEGQIFNI